MQDLIGQAKEFLGSPHRGGRIGIIGDLALDRFVQGSVERISPEAPVPVLLIEGSTDKLGCAANVCRNLAGLQDRLQIDLELFGIVGRDSAADTLRAQLKELDARLQMSVLTDSTRPTTLKTRFMAGTQHQLLRVDNENTSPLAAGLEDELFATLQKSLPKLDCLVVQDYAKGLFSPPLLQKILGAARAAGVKVLVDPNRNTPAEAYRGAHLITPNIAEAEQLLGRSLNKGQNDAEIVAACHEIKLRLALDMVMITRSRYGITLLDDKDTAHHFPAISRAVFDVTGAGDTVVAVFAGAYVCGAGLRVACALATAAASVVVAKVGTATASAAEIAAELEHLPRS